MKILAVDDDPDFLALFLHTLSELGYSDVTTALSGQDALELIETSSHHFECCILDIQMPEMNGIQLCRHIRARDGYAEVPIVMNTVMSDKSYIDDAFAAGATDYLTKPVDKTETKSRLGVVQLLVNERLRNEAGRMGSGSHITANPSYGFHDSIPMKHIDGGIDVLAMENYLNALGLFRALSVFAVGVHVTNGREIYDMEGGAVFGDVMLDVATCISDCLPFSAKMIAYKGGGDFVCLLPKRRERDNSAFGDQLLGYIAEFQRVYDELQIRLPMVSVGPATTCRATNLTTPARLIDEALALAKNHHDREVHFG
ncbi:response regulator [Marivita sp.]|uniref:response regulator n=1 Tax=Marivita sp. TaxID=2003365 RepID=UPI003F6FBB82